MIILKKHEESQKWFTFSIKQNSFQGMPKTQSIVTLEGGRLANLLAWTPRRDFAASRELLNTFMLRNWGTPLRDRSCPRPGKVI